MRQCKSCGVDLDFIAHVNGGMPNACPMCGCSTADILSIDDLRQQLAAVEEARKKAEKRYDDLVQRCNLQAGFLLISNRALTAAITRAEAAEAQLAAAQEERKKAAAERDAAIEAAVEAEQTRWQNRMDWMHQEYGVDGSGCDSGDPLDLTDTEARGIACLYENEKYDHAHTKTQLAAAQEERKKAEEERDYIAMRALCGLAGAKVPTPEAGYVKEPSLLEGDIGRLAAERDAARAEADALRAALGRAIEWAKASFEDYTRRSVELCYATSCDQCCLEYKCEGASVRKRYEMLLSETTASAALAEYTAMRAVVEAVKDACESNLCTPECKCQIGPALDTLAALRAGTHPTA